MDFNFDSDFPESGLDSDFSDECAALDLSDSYFTVWIGLVWSI